MVNRLSGNGELEGMMCAGFVSPKVIGYREIYLKYDINIRIHKMKKMEAQFDVSDQLNCSLETVRRAVKIMEGLVIRNTLTNR